MRTLSDPKYFFYGDNDIVAGINTWRKYEKIAKAEGQGDDKAIMITQ